MKIKKSLGILLALVLALSLGTAALAEEYTASAKGFGGDVTVTLTLKDGKIIKQADGLVVGDELITCFADGEVRSKVLKK